MSEGAIISKIKLKGVKLPKKEKKTHKKKSQLPESTDNQVFGVEQLEDCPLDTVLGTGLIYSTGTVVYGKGTKFVSELKHGDLIVIQHPTTLKEERKMVKLVVSDTSLSISSPFSSDISTYIEYSYYKMPEERLTEEEKQKNEEKERDEAENAAFGIYKGSGGTVFTYKERKQSAYGGWKTITKKTNRTLSREELLDMRIKHKSDRYCM